ncbi:unnamed protein product, partial [Iphiclides podalirius]
MKFHFQSELSVDGRGERSGVIDIICHDWRISLVGEVVPRRLRYDICTTALRSAPALRLYANRPMRESASRSFHRPGA